MCSAMTIQTTVTYDPTNPKESLEAVIQALQAAVDASPAGCDWHERTHKALSAIRGLRDDYAGNRRVDGA